MTEMVRWRSPCNFLALWVLLYPSLPHRSTTKLRSQIQNSDRFTFVRLWRSNKRSVQWATRRWRDSLWTLSGRGSLGSRQSMSHRNAAKNFVWWNALCKSLLMLIAITLILEIKIDLVSSNETFRSQRASFLPLSSL